MSIEMELVSDGVEINDTAEVEQSDGTWAPISKGHIGAVYIADIMKPIRQVKFILPAGTIILDKFSRVTAIVNQSVSYQVNEEEYRQALADSEDDITNAFEIIQNSNNTIRTHFETDIQDITMTHSCNVEEQ
jgi:hypothetical protein